MRRAKTRVEKIRVHRMSVEKLDKDSKADRVVRMVTPWHSRIVRDSEALSTMLSPCLDRGIQLIRRAVV